MLRALSIALLVCLPMSPGLLAEDPVFSGPQVGEPLPSFEMLGFFGEHEGKSVDLVKASDGGPVMIVFFHELTRPGFGLIRAISKFAGERTAKGLTVGVVFLSDDATETTKWALNIRDMFADKVIYGVSPDGKEGPGAYGLNRNVTLTILLGNEGKVTANFAIVQPQLQADGPAILQAIAAVTGGGEIPSIDQLDAPYARGKNMQRAQAGREMSERGGRAESDPRLGSMLRAVINKQADQATVRVAAEKVEAYIAENKSARMELARIATTIVNSGKIENYGTPTAQEFLRKWRDELSNDRVNDDRGNDDRGNDDRGQSGAGDDDAKRNPSSSDDGDQDEE